MQRISTETDNGARPTPLRAQQRLGHRAKRLIAMLGLAGVTAASGLPLTSDAALSAVPAKIVGSGGPVAAKASVTSIAATPTGNGYWLVASDGGIFSYGDAKFYGSTGNIKLNKPIVGIAATPTGDGYWLVASDGGIFSYGDAKFYGSAGGNCLKGKVTSLASSSAATGYWIAAANGEVRAYNESTTDSKGCNNPPAADASAAGGAPPAGTTAEAAIAHDMFTRLNTERAQRGLPLLSWDPELAIHARGWSTTMSVSNSFRHSDLNPLLARFTVAAENIAYGRGEGTTAGHIHVAWMKSEGHRVNMLAPNLDQVGIGVVCAADGTMWATTQFGRVPGSKKPSGFGPIPNTYPIVGEAAGNVTC